MCFPSIEQVLVTLLTTVHFALPSSVDGDGHTKEIYWKMNGLDVPVIRHPTGNEQTGQMPLDVRLAREEDYLK